VREEQKETAEEAATALDCASSAAESRHLDRLRALEECLAQARKEFSREQENHAATMNRLSESQACLHTSRAQAESAQRLADSARQEAQQAREEIQEARQEAQKAQEETEQARHEAQQAREATEGARQETKEALKQLEDDQRTYSAKSDELEAELAHLRSQL